MRCGHNFNRLRDLKACMNKQKAINSPESVSLLDGALCDEWYTIVVLSSLLQDSMPVNGNFHTFHVVFNVNDDAIALADLNTWPWNHTIDCENTTFDTIG
jgi:hypothetical protein